MTFGNTISTNQITERTKPNDAIHKRNLHNTHTQNINSNNKYHVDNMTAIDFSQNTRTRLHILYVLLLTTRKSYQQHHNCYEIIASNPPIVMSQKTTVHITFYAHST